MPTLSPQAQAIVAAFAQQPGVTQDHLSNLRAALNASPALIDQINDAVAQGHLKAIVPLTNPNAGGQYDSKRLAMQLPLLRLTTPPPGPNQSRDARINAGEITFVVGHELQHGFNRIATRQALDVFAKDAWQIAKNDPPPRDYTTPTADLLSQNRRDEAAAEIAGWNAIVSRVKTANPNRNPSLKEIFEAQSGRMRDFIDVSTVPPMTYILKPNLTLNADMTLSATPANIEAMGTNFFDKANSKLGHRGNSDYSNYYGIAPVSYIAKIERRLHPVQAGATAPQMGLDFSKLGLSEKLLEENGIDLGKHTQPLPYYDFATRPPTAHLLQHTKATHQHVSPIAEQTLAAEHDRKPSQRRSPADHDHPDHAMLEAIRNGVRGFADARVQGEAGERLSRSLLAATRQSGLSRVDHVLLGEGGRNAFAVQGDLHDPAHSRALVAVTEAVGVPVETSDARLEAANRQFAERIQLARRNDVAREVEAPGRGGPVLR